MNPGSLTPDVLPVTMRLHGTYIYLHQHINLSRPTSTQRNSLEELEEAGCKIDQYIQSLRRAGSQLSMHMLSVSQKIAVVKNLEPQECQWLTFRL